MGLDMDVGAPGPRLGTPAGAERERVWCRAEPASNASVPGCSLALLLTPGEAGPLWVVCFPPRPGSWWRALRGGCGLFGEGVKGFYNVVLCQIGKDTLCPPPFLSESLTQIKPAQSW